MIIELLRGLRIDIDNVPENLEELVAQTFSDYTEGTNRDYTFEDKLLFIDTMVQNLHHADSTDAVYDEIKSRFEYELDECGHIAGEDEYYSMEFMEQCYERGQKDAELYSFDFAKNRHDNEKIMKILVRVIKTVINWEADRDGSI